jgi:hypothetical protein
MTTIIGGALFLLPALIRAIILSFAPPNSFRGAFRKVATSTFRCRRTAVQRSLVCLLLAAMGRLLSRDAPPVPRIARVGATSHPPRVAPVAARR